MKPIVVLPIVAFATGFVLPVPQVFKQLSFEDDRSVKGTPSAPSDEEFYVSLQSEVIKSALDDTDEDEIDATSWPPHHHHGPFNLTIYELISRSKHTTKFAKLVEENESILKLLNSTEAEHTLFVPIDEAFEHLPVDGDKKPSKEFLEKLLKYHIALESYSSHKLLATHTVPTVLDEELLGGEPQRLRISSNIFSTRLNFYSRVVAADFKAKNGLVHAVRSLLVPPPVVGKELSLLPAQFSTLLLAYQKTNFVDFIHHVPLVGCTVFAPDNRAWERLGLRANAFLFNTDTGLRYLRALLKYQIAGNATLYSDAFYRADGGDAEEQAGPPHRHVDLPTLLGDKSVAVDIVRFPAFVHMVVNKHVPVTVPDAVSKNGVIHVVYRVPIPPHKHHEGAGEDDGEVDVEDLKERLRDYLDDEYVQEGAMGDL